MRKNLKNLIPDNPKPSLIHGDLWDENILFHNGKLVGLIDPGIYYAHSEMEIAYLQWFNYISNNFFQYYNEYNHLDKDFFNYSEVYQLLYDELETYSNGHNAECILAIAEGQYQDVQVVDKEINIMAMFVEVIGIVK